MLFFLSFSSVLPTVLVTPTSINFFSYPLKSFDDVTFTLNRTNLYEHDLSGIGPYTAGAISSIAFNQAEPLVDGNVIRVISRLFALKETVGQ